MSDGNIGFRMDSDPSRVIAANARVKRSEKEITQELRNTVKVSQSMAQRIIRDTESIDERYQRLKKQATAAWQQSKISADQYGRRVAQLDRDFKAVDGPFKKFRKDQEEGFGAEAQDDVDQLGTKIGALGQQLLSVLGPAALLRQGFQEVQQSIERAKENIFERQQGIGSLRQLADSQEEFDQLRETARLFYLSGGAKSLGAGADVTFQLASAGLLDDRAKSLFLQLGANQVVPDLGAFARAIATQLAAFGRGETGGATQIASKAFAASAFSPASVEQLLEAAALPGGVARFQGISDEEVLAATSLLATASGSAQQGATALRALLFSTGELAEFQGLSLRERLVRLQGKGLDTPGLKNLLGRKEAIRGFTDLENQLGRYDEVLAAVRRANDDASAIDRKLGFRDPLTFAANLSDQATARATLTREAEAAREAITDAIGREKAAYEPNTPGGYYRAGGRNLQNLLGYAVAGQRGVEFFAHGTVQQDQALTDLRAMKDTLDKQLEVMEKLLGEQVGEQKETNAKLDQQESGVAVTNE